MAEHVKEHALHDFAPGLLGIEHAPPSPLPRMVLRGVLLLLLILLVWSAFGRLDIVAVAEGKLVPVTYLKIVQPADSGIVREIAVKEGQQVEAGQVLVRMDANISEADSQTILSELQHQQLELRRIEAELVGTDLKQQKQDSPELFQHVEAEYIANRKALHDALEQEQAALEKARQELAASLEIQHKLEQTLPNYKAQEEAFAQLGKQGFAGNLMVLDKQRERIEKEQDLKSEVFTAQSLQASITQSEKKLAQIQSDYRQKLQAEKAQIYGDVQKLKQDWARQSHKNSLLELKAPQSGIIKDLATHTPGTVVSPGTVLMTLVPIHEALQAEVWIKNEDAGFVREQQSVKIKLSAYPFQKYGMLDGEVTHVSADADDARAGKGASLQGGDENSPQTGQSNYRALVKLNTQQLNTEDTSHTLTPGMQVAAEIKLGDQTVLQYLLSPVRKAFQEAGRER